MKAMRMVALFVALLLAALPLAACGGGRPLPTPAVTPDPTVGDDHGIEIEPVALKPADRLQPAVSKALADFSLDLFQRIEAQDSGKNVFLSPLSVWLALGMTYNGASGSSALGIAEALHASGIPIDDMNRDNAGLMGVLTAADRKVKIAIANSIWIRQGVASAFNKDFLERDQKYYTAQIQAIDFSQASAADTINKWVEQNTNGNIKNLVEPPIDEMSVMFLINAIHFKAPWKKAFDPKQTQDGVFKTGNGEVAAKFLFREEGNLGYLDDVVMAARLPYASGRLEMVAILPQQGTLADFVQGLAAEELQSIIAKCGETRMSLRFPKFRLEYSASLRDALIAMGMGDAFSPGVARFQNMSTELGDELFISEVKHKSFIEVDEQGTEASAATSVEMKTTGMPMSLSFDKPFLYLIRDTKTGAILFIGTLETPA